MNEKSFKELDYWYNQVNNELSEEEYTLIIVGNKKDLYQSEKIEINQGKEFANNKNAKFNLSSAKNDPLSFIEFIDKIFIEFIEKNNNKNKRRGSTLYKKNHSKNKKGCCE